ncbi:MAG: hypothetical protein LBJ11_08620 [Oscillospiraceae bacterium]|jgi:predicted PurR-regulated permease PerM|nr:hypothetical protein [Oscillospiraceae bacterium]
MFKKVLAALLTVLTIFSVLFVVANAATPSLGTQTEASDPASPTVSGSAAASSAPATTQTETNQWEEFWNWIYPILKTIYEYGFVFISNLGASLLGFVISGVFG